MELKNLFFLKRGFLKTWIQPTAAGLIALAFAGGQLSYAATLGMVEHDVGAVSKGMELVPQKKGLIVGDPTKNKEFSFLKESILRAAGFIQPNFSGDGKIIKVFEEILAVGRNEVVYLDFGTNEGAYVGAEYAVYRIDHFVYHPVYRGSSNKGVLPPAKGVKFGGDKVQLMEITTRDKTTIDKKTHQPVGYLTIPLGKVQILDVAKDQSKALVTESYQTISVGDYLTPYKEHKVPDVDEPEAKNLKAYIVAAKNPESTIGDTSIVYLDRGSNQNVEPGDHFEIYLTPKEGISTFPPDFKSNTVIRSIGENPLMDERSNRPLLDQRVGRLMVLATQPETSTAIILESVTPIQIGNKVRSILP